MSTVDWNPLTELEKIHPIKLRYSRGLFKSTPEKWFPALLAYWIPVLETFGCDYKLESVGLEVEPEFSTNNYSAKFDDDIVTLSFDQEAARIISEVTSLTYEKVISDYFAMRIFKSLVQSWSGKSLGKYEFLGELTGKSTVIGIVVKAKISGKNLKLNFLLSKNIADKLDLLWRRQVVQAVQVKTEVTARMQLAEIPVPNSKLNEYLAIDSLIDISKTMDPTLIVNNQPWRRVELVTTGGNFGIISKQPIERKEQTGISVDLISFKTDTVTLAELAQADAGLDLGVAVSNKVRLSIAGQTVGVGKIVDFQGKLAVQVLPTKGQ